MAGLRLLHTADVHTLCLYIIPFACTTASSPSHLRCPVCVAFLTLQIVHSPSTEIHEKITVVKYHTRSSSTVDSCPKQDFCNPTRYTLVAFVVLFFPPIDNLHTQRPPLSVTFTRLFIREMEAVWPNTARPRKYIASEGD